MRLSSSGARRSRTAQSDAYSCLHLAPLLQGEWTDRMWPSGPLFGSVARGSPALLLRPYTWLKMAAVVQQRQWPGCSAVEGCLKATRAVAADQATAVVGGGGTGTAARHPRYQGVRPRSGLRSYLQRGAVASLRPGSTVGRQAESCALPCSHSRPCQSVDSARRTTAAGFGS
jgi:hypothetical protein